MHVEQDADDGDRRAEAHPDGEDPHVLDARVGEQPLEVPLAQEIEGGKHERGEAEDKQDRPRERRPEAAHARPGKSEGWRRSSSPSSAPDSERRDRCRRLGVRVGEPRVDRDESHLRPEAEHGEHVGEPHHVLGGKRRAPESSLP